jgi:hypothetical protein
MGKRFIEVPAEALLGLLQEDIGTKVEAAGGEIRKGCQGREIVVDIKPPNRQAFLRVYTTLSVGADQVRDCGDDAIRLVVGYTPYNTARRGSFVPVARSRKLLRTAPKGTESERLTAFLGRLKDALREGYVECLRHPTCPDCGKVMALREPRPGGKKFRPFYGCIGYPDCKRTVKA